MKVSAGAAGLLGDGEVAVDGLVLELVHELGLDFGRAVVVEDAPVHIGCVMQVHAHAARTAGELFLNTQDLEFVEVPSAVLRGKIETIQIVLLREFVELFGEGVGDFDFLLDLFEGAFDQFANLLQIRLELLVGDFGIGIHETSSSCMTIRVSSGAPRSLCLVLCERGKRKSNSIVLRI